MRSLLFVAILLPCLAGAQINRSARELASEKVREYISQKLFKNKTYKPVSFGDIKMVGDKRSDIVWTIVHQFEISEGGSQSFDNSAAYSQRHKFLFYLDEKMKVLKAETSYSR